VGDLGAVELAALAVRCAAEAVQFETTAALQQARGFRESAADWRRLAEGRRQDVLELQRLGGAR